MAFEAETDILRAKGGVVIQQAEEFVNNVKKIYQAVYEMGSSSYISAESMAMVQEIDNFHADLDKMANIIAQYGAYCQGASKAVVNTQNNIIDSVKSGSVVTGGTIPNMDLSISSQGSYQSFGAYKVAHAGVVITYEKTLANAATIMDCSTKMRNIFEDFSTTINQVTAQGTFAGSAADALRGRFNSLRGSFERYTQTIKEFSDMITGAANATKETEQKLAQQAENLMNQG